MNYRIVLNILGKTMIIGAILMCIPIIVALIYAEIAMVYYCFLIPIGALLVLGLPLSFIKIKDKSIYAREGLVIVALAWIIMSLAGCLPFILSGEIPSFAGAFFETVSGFTTTGASVMDGIEIEAMYRSTLFWRMFTHWIGGMGVLVFVLAVLPGYNEGAMHVMRAESPGPSVGKLVSKISFTARILYSIYFVMTVLEIIMLIAGGMPVFDSIVYSFSTAGTGGFSMKADGVASYSVYSQMVMAVFMYLFAINFNVFYLITIRQFGKAFKCEEFRIFTALVICSTLAIALNLFVSTIELYDNFGIALKDAFFQVTSIVSTTGLSNVAYDTAPTLWPVFSHTILVLLTIIGACAGSTGGGLKISRCAILFKSGWASVKKQLRPRQIINYKFEGQPVDEVMDKGIKNYLVLWFIILLASVLLLSLDTFTGGDFTTHITASLACIGNVGPGLGAVGPSGNYACYSDLSQIWLCFVMLVGRLEIFPMLILFSPRTWRKH